MAIVNDFDEFTAVLRRSEEQRRLAFDAAGLGTWDWDVMADLAAVDERGRQLFGFPVEGPITYATAVAAIHPEDRAAVEERVRRALDPASDGTHEAEHRVVWPDGSVRWLFAKGQAYFEGERADRRAVRFIGVVMDVTERKRGETALRESEERLRVALANAPLIVYHCDRELRYTWIANPHPDWAPEHVTGRRDDEFLSPEQAAPLIALKRSALESGVGVREEVSLDTSAGRQTWDVTVEPLRDAAGRITGLTVAALEITGRKRAERALRESEERLRLALDAGRMGTWDWDPRTDRLVWDARQCELFAIDPARAPSLTADSFLRLVHPHDLRRVKLAMQATLDGRGDFIEEFRVVPRGGQDQWLAGRGGVVAEPDGKPARIIGVNYDITERKEAERALRESEAWFRGTFENAAVGMAHVGVDGTWLRINERLCDTLGYTQDELLAKTFQDITHPDDLAPDLEQTGRLLRGEISSYRMEKRYIHKDGHVVWAHLTGSLYRDGGGKPLFAIAVVQDITESKRVEAALADSAARLRLITDALPVLISYVDVEQRYRFVNKGYEDWFGHGRAEIEGRSPREVLGEEAFEAIRKKVAAALAGQPVVYEAMVPYRDGGTRYVEARYMPHRGPNGEVLGFYALIVDISERKRAEEAIARAAATRRAILDALPAHIAVLDRAGNIVTTNAAWDRFAIENGYRGPSSWMKVNYLAVCDAARGDRAEGADAVARGIRAVLAGEQARFTLGSAYPCHAPNQERWFELIAVPLPEQPTDGAVIMHIDITERKQAERGLREQEDQLRQAQKMEALGQLTGGIAHDFNNLLALVMMDLEMIAGLAATDTKVRSLANEARAVAQTGADLTGRLLAFARRQHLEPRAVDVNELVGTMVDLLRRSLGELIEIRVAVGEDLWPAEADPAQLENAVLNLAINARDAMPQGGVITIETGSESVTEEQAHTRPGVSPGSFVTVTVADTGTGMPPEVLGRVFEPFFTTKEAGRGTGLGLSMVYGFVKQSGGHVSMRSEVGGGTRVTLHLPRAKPGALKILAPHPPPRTGTGETVLIVEDHEPLRDRVALALSNFGYRVVKAANAGEALQALAEGEHIDLLFTDVVMPGTLDGRGLAERVRQRWPRVRVLYTSGYPDYLRPGQGEPGSGRLALPLLAKPYTLDELARAVRRELDGPD